MAPGNTLERKFLQFGFSRVLAGGPPGTNRHSAPATSTCLWEGGDPTGRPERKPVAVGTVVAWRDPRAGLRPRFDNAARQRRRGGASSRLRPDTCPARWPRLHGLTSDPATHRQRAMVLGLALDNADIPHHWPRPRATHRDHHQRAARHPPRPDHPLRPPHDQRTTPRRDHPRVCADALFPPSTSTSPTSATLLARPCSPATRHRPATPPSSPRPSNAASWKPPERSSPATTPSPCAWNAAPTLSSYALPTCPPRPPYPGSGTEPSATNSPETPCAEPPAWKSALTSPGVSGVSWPRQEEPFLQGASRRAGTGSPAGTARRRAASLVPARCGAGRRRPQRGSASAALRCGCGRGHRRAFAGLGAGDGGEQVLVVGQSRAGS